MKGKRNPVAKNARKVNRAAVHKSKVKYDRKRIKRENSHDPFFIAPYIYMKKSHKEGGLQSLVSAV